MACGALGRDAYGALGGAFAVAASALSWFSIAWWARPVELGGVLLARAMLATTVSEPLPWALLEGVLFVTHRDPVNRFVAAAALFGALSVAWPEATPWLVVVSLAIAVAIGVTRTWWAEAPSALREPLWYGALGLVAFALIGPSVATFGTFSAVTLGVLAAAFAGAAAAEASRSLIDRLAAVAFSAALATFCAPVPGVMVALFAKGGAMVATGLVLLAGGSFAGRYRDR